MKKVYILSLAFFSAIAFGVELPKDIEKPGDLATVVVFLSAKCPCSASHEPVLKDLAEEYRSKKVRFIGVHSNADEPVEMSKLHFVSSKLPFEVKEDSDQKWANAFGAIKTPHAYIIQKGELVYQGGVDDSSNAPDAKKHYLKDALAAIVSGKKPEVQMARALGCVIKRK